MDRGAVRGAIERATRRVNARPDWKRDILSHSSQPTLRVARRLVDNRGRGSDRTEASVAKHDDDLADKAGLPIVGVLQPIPPGPAPQPEAVEAALVGGVASAVARDYEPGKAGEDAAAALKAFRAEMAKP